MIAYKYRIYPNKQQREQIEKEIGCARFVYNWGLEKRIEAYQKDKQNLTGFALIKELPSMKKEFPWLKDVCSQSLQMTLRNLDNAYTKFFRDKKGFPRFKSKHGRNSFQCPQGFIIVDESHIKLPKLKIIKTKIDREFIGKPKTWTIEKTKTNKYYISILSDCDPSKERISDNEVGIDLGIKDFATLSTGEKIENPKWQRKTSKKLSYVQRQHSKKLKGGRNREKSRLKVAKYHEKIVNQRKDWQHKWSTKLVSENQVICLEDLNVAGMLKNHHLARSVQECAWSQFVSFLEYKAKFYRTEIIRIGRFEPSSKMCSCGKVNSELTLADRIWTCKHCGTTHDRDVLAANNILRFGLNRRRLDGEKPLELPTLVGAMN